MTLKEYLSGGSHREYYAQFVYAATIEHIVRVIGAERLQASADPYFHDIRITEWDIACMGMPFLGNLLKELGDSRTLSGLVCIAKEAAHQYLDSLVNK